MAINCGDTLSLQDLQTAKKHQIFEAEVITGKAGGVASGADIDSATNQVTGQTQKTLPAVLRDAGFLPASFDFTTGGTLGVNDRNKVVFDPVSKTWYSWEGALPHVIAAGTNPVSVADWKPQTDPNLRNELTTPNSGLDVDASNVNIPAVSPATKNIPLNVFAEQMVSLAMFTGVVADGVTDTRAGVQAAIDACALAKKTLYIPDGTYAFANFFTQPSNSRIVFGEHAWFKLLNNTTFPGNSTGMGGFQIIGYNYNDFYQPDGVTPKVVEATNVSTVGMKLDCNNIGGENAINGIFCKNIRHVRSVVKNTLHTQEKLGGRAFQWEGNLIQDVIITDATILDCSIGHNSQALTGSTTQNVRAVTYNGLFMNNVGVPFNLDNGANNPELADALISSVSAFNVTLHNCGAPRAPFADSLAGGIVCGDRGAGLYISGFRLVNDASYGGISALFRGVMFNVSICNADITATYIVALVDQTPPAFGNPSQAGGNAFVKTRNVKINANLDYIAKSPNDSVGPHSLKLDVDMAKATIANIFDTHIATNPTLANLAMIEINDTSTGTGSGYRSFNNLFLAGNTPVTCIKRKDATGTLTLSDGSGAALTITPNGTQRYTRDGESVSVAINVTYPTTADTRPAVISGLPLAGIAGVNFTGIASVLNGPSGSFAVVKSGENFIRFNTQTGANVTNADLSGKNISLTLKYMF